MKTIIHETEKAGKEGETHHFINPNNDKRTLCGRLITKTFTFCWLKEDKLDDWIGCDICKKITNQI